MSTGDLSAVTVQLKTAMSTDRVWKALVDRDEVKQWFFPLEDFQPFEGFEFSFEGQAEDRTYMHHCIITEVIPGKKLSYSWAYEGYGGKSQVNFYLQPEENGSTLELVHEGLENFSPANPDFDPANFRKGWEHIIKISLKDQLESSPAG
jgi:uncharacterized protein YndB with AHSA1/START domain